MFECQCVCVFVRTRARKRVSVCKSDAGRKGMGKGRGCKYWGQSTLACSVASLRAPPPSRHLTITHTPASCQLPLYVTKSWMGEREGGCKCWGQSTPASRPALLVTKSWDGSLPHNNPLHGCGCQISSAETR